MSEFISLLLLLVKLRTFRVTVSQSPQIKSKRNEKRKKRKNPIAHLLAIVDCDFQEHRHANMPITKASNRLRPN